MLQPKLHIHHEISIDDVLVTGRPRAYAFTTAGLVGVFSTRVELAVGVLGNVQIMIRELGALVVVAFRVGNHFLKRRRVDLISDWFPIDRVAHSGVLDFENAVGVWVEIEACGSLDEGFLGGVADAVGVEGRARHGMAFLVDEAISVAVDGRVDAEGEDVLVVCCQHARVNDGAPGDRNTRVDGLGADDTGGADLVGEFAGLVEHEGEDVLVVRDGDDGLDDELAVAGDGGAAGAIVRMFPADAVVLFVDADDVFHGHGVAGWIGKDGAKVVDGAQAVATEFEVVGHDAGAGVAEVESGFFVKGRPGVGIRDIHVGEGEAVKKASAVVTDLSK